MDTHRKIDFLRYGANLDNSPSIICSTEYELGKCIDDSEVSLPGYIIYQYDRDRWGGGVTVYCHSDIKADMFDNLPEDIEHCTLLISVSCGQPFFICCVNCHHLQKPEWNRYMQELLNKLINYQKPILLNGNFNFDLWKNNSFAENLRVEYHLFQPITKPILFTRMSKMFLDYIYTSSKVLITESGITEMHIFDHRANFCTFSNSHNMHRPKCLTAYRSFYQLNNKKLTTNMNALPWSLPDTFDDANDIADMFYDLYLDRWDQKAPLK